MKKIIVFSVLAVVCFTTNKVNADCDSTAGMHYPSQVPPNYQGSAQIDSFNCAINGSKQLSLEEMNARSDLIPPNLNNRFYLLLGGNAAAEGVTSVKNASTYNNSTTRAIGALSDDSNKVASNNFELGIGYVWKEIAVELEWVALKSVPFSTEITGISPTFTFNSTVKGDSLLGNIYWIFQDMYNVKVYGDLIVGYTKNNTVSSINGGTGTAINRYRISYGLGVGGRFNIVSRLYADIIGRYVILGPVRMEATNGANYAYLKATRTWLGASVRLLWLI